MEGASLDPSTEPAACRSLGKLCERERESERERERQTDRQNKSMYTNVYTSLPPLLLPLPASFFRQGCGERDFPPHRACAPPTVAPPLSLSLSLSLSLPLYLYLSLSLPPPSLSLSLSLSLTICSRYVCVHICKHVGILPSYAVST